MDLFKYQDLKYKLFSDKIINYYIKDEYIDHILNLLKFVIHIDWIVKIKKK